MSLSQHTEPDLVAQAFLHRQPDHQQSQRLKQSRRVELSRIDHIKPQVGNQRGNDPFGIDVMAADRNRNLPAIQLPH